jgi:hypothetical protein
MRYSSEKCYRDILMVEVNKTIKKLEEEDSKNPSWVISLIKKIKDLFKL